MLADVIVKVVDAVLVAETEVLLPELVVLGEAVVHPHLATVVVVVAARRRTAVVIEEETLVEVVVAAPVEETDGGAETVHHGEEVELLLQT